MVKKRNRDFRNREKNLSSNTEQKNVEFKVKALSEKVGPTKILVIIKGII